MKQVKCNHQFMFNIALGTDCWHITPHPTKKQEQQIAYMLDVIIEDLLNQKNNKSKK